MTFIIMGVNGNCLTGCIWFRGFYMFPSHRSDVQYSRSARQCVTDSPISYSSFGFSLYTALSRTEHGNKWADLRPHKALFSNPPSQSRLIVRVCKRLLSAHFWRWSTRLCAAARQSHTLAQKVHLNHWRERLWRAGATVRTRHELGIWLTV